MSGANTTRVLPPSDVTSVNITRINASVTVYNNTSGIVFHSRCCNRRIDQTQVFNITITCLGKQTRIITLCRSIFNKQVSYSMIITIKVAFKNDRVHSNRFPRNTVKVQVGSKFKSGQLTLLGDRDETCFLLEGEGVLIRIIIEIVSTVDTISEFSKLLLINHQEWVVHTHKQFHFLTRRILMHGIRHKCMEFNQAPCT